VKQVHTQFGAGLISPQLVAHLKRSQDEKKTSTKVEFGAGLIAPTVKSHVKRSQVEFGAGLIHPRVAARRTAR
jgi:hypothetical protein